MCGCVGRSALSEEGREDETINKEMASIVSQMAIKVNLFSSSSILNINLFSFSSFSSSSSSSSSS